MNRIIPTYDLYGERQAISDDPQPEFLCHCEEIHERSRIHGWEIRPHRHRRLFQLLLVFEGTADLSDGKSSRAIDLPAIILVPCGSVHGFRFSSKVQGFVLTFDDRRLRNLLAGEADVILSASGPFALDLGSAGDIGERIMRAASSIPADYRERAVGQVPLLEGQLTALLALCLRLMPRRNTIDTPESRDEARISRLARLIDQHFREHRPVDFYASALGISATHLNRILRERQGTTLQILLSDRLIDEAKRSLVFGVQPVKAIAFGLGFSDTAYFSRFFHRRTGLQPTRYRELQQDRQEQHQ